MLNKITLHIASMFPLLLPHQMPNPPKAFSLQNLEETDKVVFQTQNLTLK